MQIVDEKTKILIKNEIKSALDAYHLCYNVQVTNFLTNYFKEYNKTAIRSYCEKIAKMMRNTDIEVKALSLDSLKVIIKNLSQSKSDTLRVLNVFKDSLKGTDDSKENEQIKSFIPYEKDVCRLQTNRLHVIRRLIDNPESTVVSKIPGELRNISYLYGYDKLEKVITIIGCAFKDSNGIYILEDHENTINMKISKNCLFGDGILSEGAPLMFTGKYSRGAFTALKIDLPPIVRIPRPQNNCKINIHDKFIILSEVNLDNGECLKSIHLLLNGFSQSPPKCIIFMGNFVTSPQYHGSLQEYNDGFRRLANILKDINELHPVYKDVEYVFVPGDQDLPSSILYPKLPLPKCIQSFFNDNLKVTFTSNPTYITNKGQKMLICRSNNLIEKMCRDTFHSPKDVAMISEEFGKTIISMRHIQPLPNYVLPLSPGYDNVMSLEELPDAIILGDRFKSYKHTINDCIIANPGQFCKANDFEFMVYYPHDKSCDYSAIGSQ
uniref:DNA polymerase II subunit 2 n=1 Tax=Parastrongyloides trichosuri TaxID=131310 RepID=A0A0N5A5D6_PARTI